MGQVHYRNSGIPVAGSVVSLTNDRTLAALTGLDGRFGFFGVPAETWRLEVDQDVSILPAITAADAVHVLEIAAADTPVDEAAHVAADVSGNGEVTSYDAVLILQRKVGALASFPVESACERSWYFVADPQQSQPGQQVVPPSIDAETCSSGAILYNPLAGVVVDQNFVAGAFGDVDASWDPSILQNEVIGSAVARVANDLGNIRVGRGLRRGRYVRVPVYLEPGAAARAIDLTIPIPEGMVPVGVRKGRNAFGALVAASRETKGELKISMASRTPLEPGLIVTVGFKMDERGRPPRVRASSARLD